MASDTESEWEVPERHLSLTRIKYLEGKHKRMPLSLLKQISHHLDIEGSKVDFAMGKWRERTLTTSDGGAAWFEMVVDAAGALQRLTATRYQYGPQKQIVVVDLTEYDSTRPVIVVGSGKSTYNKMQRGRPNIKAYIWHVWAPKDERDESYKSNSNPILVRIAEGSPVKEEAKDESINEIAPEKQMVSAPVKSTGTPSERVRVSKKRTMSDDVDTRSQESRTKRAKASDAGQLKANSDAKPARRGKPHHEISAERVRELTQYLVDEHLGTVAPDYNSDDVSQYTRASSAEPNRPVKEEKPVEQGQGTDKKDRALFTIKIEPQDEQLQASAIANVDKFDDKMKDVPDKPSNSNQGNDRAPLEPTIDPTSSTTISFDKIQVVFETNEGQERSKVVLSDCCSAAALFEEACAAGIADPKTRMLAVKAGEGEFAAIRKDNDSHFERKVLDPVQELPSEGTISDGFSIRVRWYM